MASEGYDLTSANGSVVFRTLPEGAKVWLANGAVGEITGNPGDGAYLMIRITENEENPAQVGEEEYVFFSDVKKVE